MVKFGAFLKKQIEGDEWKDHYLKVCNTHSHCARLTHRRRSRTTLFELIIIMINYTHQFTYFPYNSFLSSTHTHTHHIPSHVQAIEEIDQSNSSS